MIQEPEVDCIQVYENDTRLQEDRTWVLYSGVTHGLLTFLTTSIAEIRRRRKGKRRGGEHSFLPKYSTPVNGYLHFSNLFFVDATYIHLALVLVREQQYHEVRHRTELYLLCAKGCSRNGRVWLLVTVERS